MQNLQLPPAVQPLGTIITSILDYSKFLLSPFNPSSSQWAPADGRNVQGSHYASVIAPNVPDLRGQFLRGSNSFLEDGNAPTTIFNGADLGARNPDANNYSFQKEDVMAHKHTVTDEGHNHGLVLGTTAFDGNGTPAYRPAGRGDVGVVTDVRKSNVTIDLSNGEGTWPNNVQVYFYIRIN